MRPAALQLLVLAGCLTPAQHRERTGETANAFASAESVLVDLELDGKLVADGAAGSSFEPLVATQLTYLVGQLNGERSVGQHQEAQFSITSIDPSSTTPSTSIVTYHAKIPVAWGGGPPPTTYSVILPSRVGQADRVAFAEKYAGTCTDPEGAMTGADDEARMFLFYRPLRAGCTLSPEDVFITSANVVPSAKNTTDKYPEYHRVWEDDELDVVAVFGSELDAGRAEDSGVAAYDAFVDGADTYLRSLQGTTATSPIETGAGAGRSVRVSAILPDARRIQIDAVLVPPHLAEERSTFDDWYDARTPDADLIIYSGHAGLGENVRALSQKGSFRAKKYVVFFVNGCDTFAYLDRTLANRRATLNPDDPAGTKYMDTVSNVLGGYFRSGDKTSLHMIRELVGALAGTPKTYEGLLAGIDATQIAVVTGEEDNEFVPGMVATKSLTGQADAAFGATRDYPRIALNAPSYEDASGPRNAEPAMFGCSVVPNAGHAPPVLAAVAWLLARRRRKRPKTRGGAIDAMSVDGSMCGSI
ncbi:MAG TPA: hypothetical protein VM925_16380, partial [Labilithrix sp.]|nr:hypothetical protein [Labilithrix sp.]